MTNNTELMPLILAGDGYQMTLSSANDPCGLSGIGWRTTNNTEKK